MREFVRPVTALSAACLAIAMAAASAGGALAQAQPTPPAAQAAPQPPAVKQLVLTDKQIEGVLAAQKDMDAITEKLPPNTKPDPKAAADLNKPITTEVFRAFQ